MTGIADRSLQIAGSTARGDSLLRSANCALRSSIQHSGSSQTRQAGAGAESSLLYIACCEPPECRYADVAEKLAKVVVGGQLPDNLRTRSSNCSGVDSNVLAICGA